MSTLPDTDLAIYGKLSGTAGVTALVSTRIYPLQAPAGAALPYIIYQNASGIHPNIVPRATLDYIYRISCWSATSRAHAYSILQAVYSALHGQTLSITGWTNYKCTQDRIQAFSEIVNAVSYWRYVADYRIRASED